MDTDAPLFAAAKEGKVKELADLIAGGVDIEAVNEWQLTALHVAVTAGHFVSDFGAA